jgi:hypothetical protein
LLYDSSRNEIVYSTATATQSKTFIIDHPIDNTKYLVHACLEGPETGIYYRGKGEITNNTSVVISLPSYVSEIGYDYTVQLTNIHTDNNPQVFSTSEVVNGQFTVFGKNGSFFWLVHANRSDIIIEPLKSECEIKGLGPYTWI